MAKHDGDVLPIVTLGHLNARKIADVAVVHGRAKAKCAVLHTANHCQVGLLQLGGRLSAQAGKALAGAASNRLELRVLREELGGAVLGLEGGGLYDGPLEERV